MTFTRVVIAAFLTSTLVDLHGWAARLVAIALAAAMWWAFAPDPTSRLIDKALEDFARKHRQ